MSVFWRRFIVNHRKHHVRFFSDISRCQHRLFKKFLRHFLDFTDVGPEWFLAKLRCAYCICLVLLLEISIYNNNVDILSFNFRMNSTHSLRLFCLMWSLSLTHGSTSRQLNESITKNMKNGWIWKKKDVSKKNYK